MLLSALMTLKSWVVSVMTNVLPPPLVVTFDKSVRV